MADSPHAPSTTGAPSQPAPDVLAWLRGKTLADWKTIEILDPGAAIPTQLFHDVIRHRNGKGEQCETPVLFKIPTEDDMAIATGDAVAHVARISKAKDITTPEQAMALVGKVRFVNFETAAVVAICVRSPEPPHGRRYLLNVLVQSFLPGSIADAFDRLDMLRRTWDVRVGDITEEQAWAFMAEIARVRNIGPLAVLDAALQNAFIVRAADICLTSRTSPSSAGSSEHLMPA